MAAEATAVIEPGALDDLVGALRSRGLTVLGPSRRDGAIVYEKHIDVAAETARLSKDLSQYEKEIGNADRQLGNEGFLAKAPGHVVEGIRKRRGELELLIAKANTALEALRNGSKS